MSNKLMSIQSYSLNLPNIPPRSSLYSLEPIGVGTPLVESFTSYLSRLAEEHCLLPTTLIKKYIIPNTEKDPTNLEEIYRTAVLSYSERLNSSGNMAASYVSTLEKLTLRSDLKFLTLLTFSDVLASRDLVRKHRHWCPDCYYEWHSSGQTVYEPLLWTINVVNTCPFHGNSLSSLCPSCNKKVPILKGQSRVGYCSNCGLWLGSNSLGDFSYVSTVKKQVEWESWVSSEVGYLLANMPNFSSNLTISVIARKLSAYAQVITLGNKQAFAKKLGVRRQMLTSLCMGKLAPLLRNLLYICYCLNISPSSLLDPDLNFEVSADELFVVKENRNVDDIRSILESILNNNVCPPTPHEISLHLGCSIGYLHAFASNLCQELVKKRTAYIHSENSDKAQSKTHYRRGMRRNINPDEIREKLSIVLENVCPPSLTEMSQHLGYSISCLYNHASDLCQELVQKRMAYVYSNSSQAETQYESSVRRKVDSNEIRTKLENILEQDYTSPPSLKTVSKELGIDESVLRRYAQDLCCAISDRYLSFRKMSAERNLKEACDEVRRIANELYSEGVSPTIRRVGERLTKPGYLRNKDVQNALYEERRKLGI